MKYYKKLLELGCFTREDIIKLVGTDAGATSLIYDYLKKGYIQRVKRNLYVTISLENDCPILNRYQIGSHLFEDAFISHHSALEIIGSYNQVYYECYVSTKHRFKDFTYDGVTYHRVDSENYNQIENNNKTKYTTKERSIVDSIKDYKKISDLEETLKCLLLTDTLDENKILNCLETYHNGFLYQKCGYIFESLNYHLHFSSVFFKKCKNNISDSKRYFDEQYMCKQYNKKWKLYVPNDITEYTDKGIDLNAIG